MVPRRVTRIGGCSPATAEIEGVARLDELWPNLRAAFDWACTTGDRGSPVRSSARSSTRSTSAASSEIGDWAERILAVAPPDDADLVLFGLIWAAERYMRTHGHARLRAPRRPLRRAGPPDGPPRTSERLPGLRGACDLGRRGRGRATQVRRRRPGRTVRARRRSRVAVPGRFAEHDSVVAALVDRYRAQGPPTLLNLTLVMLGYSASVQGTRDRAEQLFDDAIDVEVPQRTHSPNKAIEAGAVFRRGDRTRAFRILRTHVDELLDDDNMQAACVTTVEFVNMTATVDRLPDAARMLGFLETTGLLDAPAWRTLVEEAESKIAADVHPHLAREQASGRNIGHRQALEYMREVLRQLADGHLDYAAAGYLTRRAARRLNRASSDPPRLRNTWTALSMHGWISPGSQPTNWHSLAKRNYSKRRGRKYVVRHSATVWHQQCAPPGYGDCSGTSRGRERPAHCGQPLRPRPAGRARGNRRAAERAGRTARRGARPAGQRLCRASAGQNDLATVLVGSSARRLPDRGCHSTGSRRSPTHSAGVGGRRDAQGPPCCSSRSSPWLPAGAGVSLRPRTGSAGFVVISALCPVWDHHQVGSWWFGQSAISVAMFAGSMILRSRAARATVRAER